MPATKKNSKASKTTKTSKSGTSRRTSQAASHATIDHQEIQRWAEERQGEPACVRGTGGKGDTGMIRIDFPGGGRAASREKLQPISWDDWFEKFDERGLALLYQDKTASGRISRFNKLVSRETAEAANQKSGAKTMKAT
jgi:hypothetical protein